MNKKFSTLLAAFLAAGALTTANATDFKDIANGGRYFQLEQTGQFSSGWVAAPASGYFMSLDAAGKVIFSKTQKDWWTVVSKQVAGQTYFQLVNKDGRAFSYTYNDGTKDVKIDWFLSDYAAANINDLSFMKAGTRTYLGCGAQRGTTDVWDLAEAVGATNPRGFDAIEVSTEYTRTMINSIKGDGFGLQIGYLSAKTKDFADYALKGAEALQGKLVAVDNMSGADATTNAKDFYLFNSSAKAYVVLVKDKWSVNGTDLLSGTGKGYKWTLMTKKQYDADKALGAYSTIIADKFSFTETYYTNGPRLEVVALDAYDVTTPSVIDADAELFVAEVDASNYLTTNAAINAAGTLTHGDKDGLPSYYSATWVRFGDSNVLDASEFYGYAVTVLGLNKATENKTLRPVFTTAGTAEWVNAEYVAMTQPEGQWIYTGEWTNRETGENASAWFNGLRHDSGDVYYEVRGGETYKYELKKTDALGGNSFNYYGEYEASNEAAGEPRSYKISFYNKTSEEYNYVGFNGKGELILTNNVANAVVFDLAKVKKTNDMNAQGKVEADALVDVINIINPAILKNQKGEWQRYANGDTISFYRYTFNYGGKQLKYDANSGKLTLTTAGDYFVIKQKDGDVVNVLNVGTKDYDNTSVVGTDATGKYSQKYAPKNWECGRELLTGKWVANTAIDAARNTYDKAEMLYFDNNHALLKQQANIYQWEANAQLVIDDDATVAYRSLEAHKTYEFFRTEFSDEFLFERGEFLGMTTNRFDYNPAIFVDTAYVRYETVKPLYMLAVGVNETAESTYCPIHGTEPCDHALDVPGNIAARYLVSYTDSVAKYAALVQNPYCYTNTKLTKLGFVPAIHKVDSVFVGDAEEPTFVFGEQKVTPISFAFRIVNPETEDFIIETGAKTNNGYTTNFIKWHNGCPVLTANMNEAEVFNVRASEAEATANEAVAAEVSVVAAQGAIIVKGAAGKVVTVANILGQTIANQVAASDNVTIAAPAGIAVVTVDGEATKVVVK